MFHVKHFCLGTVISVAGEEVKKALSGAEQGRVSWQLQALFGYKLLHSQSAAFPLLKNNYCPT